MNDISYFEKIRGVLLDLVESLNNGNGLSSEPLAKMHFDAATERVIALKKRELTKHMVDRFLGWKLPEDFSPDAGISFDPDYKGWDGKHHKLEPVGTNLLTATQAEEMVKHMLEGMGDE